MENEMSKSTSFKSEAAVPKIEKSSAPASRRTRNIKFIIGAGALVLALGALVIASRPDAVKAQAPVAAPQAPVTGGSTGRLAALRTKFDFGSISMAGGKVTHRFPIRNTGTEPIVVHKMYTSCMCTTAALVKNGKTSDAYGMPGHTPVPTIDVPITPQDQVSVEVVFDPAAHGPAGVGLIERVVTLENNAGEPLELQFAATVTP